MIECIKGEYTMMQTSCDSSSNIDQDKKKQRLTKDNDLDFQEPNAFSTDPSLTLQKAPTRSTLEAKDARSIARLTLQKASPPSFAISKHNLSQQKPMTDSLCPCPPTNFWLENLLTIINSMVNVPCTTPSPPLFEFKLTLEAAHKNYCIMRKFNNNIEKALNAQQHTPLGYA
jgi:hypothetical protein